MKKVFFPRNKRLILDDSPFYFVADDSCQILSSIAAMYPQLILEKKWIFCLEESKCIFIQQKVPVGKSNFVGYVFADDEDGE